jgi:hypothetical protein
MSTIHAYGQVASCLGRLQNRLTVIQSGSDLNCQLRYRRPAFAELWRFGTPMSGTEWCSLANVLLSFVGIVGIRRFGDTVRALNQNLGQSKRFRITITGRRHMRFSILRLQLPRITDVGLLSNNQ